MSNINTTATVNLTINGQQPIQVLQQLKQNALQLESAIARAAAAGNKTDLRRLRKELTDTRRQIREIESSTMQVESVMRRLNRATPNELNRTLQTLNRQLQYLERGSAAWNAHVAKIQRVKGELAKLNAKLRAQEGFWKRFTRTMNDWQSSIFMTAALLSGVVMAGRRAVNSFAEMEEQMANTRKYTQMAKEEVDKLNDAFKNMDTRTGRDKLNEFAQEAGRLGKTTMDDVQGYVEAADILSVALVDLGEGATQTIAKISNIFGVEQLLGTKEAMLSVGSTVNVLSQNCTASKPYLVEFAQRLAGVGAQAHMTIPEILAFGATLDANGQKVEMAASALSRTIMKLFQSPEEIAQAVGLNVQEFTETLKESTNEGLLMFLERLHQIGDKDALAALSPLFKDLGMDGIRMAQVLSVLSGKLEMVRWEQQEANKAFDEAISATREYNIFNNTAQAGIEKAKKRIHELAVELGEKLLPVYRHIMTSGSAMLRLLNMIADFIITYKSAIITAVAAWVSYTLAVNASNIAFKAHYYWLVITQGAMKLLSTVTLALKIAFFAVTGQIERAKAAYTAFHLLTKSTPWGIIIAAITAVGVALYNMATQTKETTKAEKELQRMNEELAETRKRYQERLDVEKRRIMDLVAVARDDKASMEQRKKAIDTLNRIIPNYCAKLDSETKKYHENKKALDDYLVSLERKIRLEANRAEYERLIKEDERLTREIYKAEEYEKARVQGSVDSHSGSGAYYMKVEVAHAYGASMGIDGKITGVQDTKQVKALKGQRGVVRSQIERLVKYAGKENLISTESPQATEPVITDPSYSPGGGGSSSGGSGGSHKSTRSRGGSRSGSQKKEDKFAAEKSWREREEALTRISYATGVIDYEDYNEKMSQIVQEFYEKQLAHTDLSENERLKIMAQYAEEALKMEELKYKHRLKDEKDSYAELRAETMQDYIDGKLSKKAYDMQMENIEYAHLRALVNLADEGSAERVEAEENLRKKLIEGMEQRQKEYEEKERKHQAELKKIKDEYFDNNAVEDKQEFDAAMALLEEQYRAELEMVGDNAKEKLRIEEAYEKAKLALKKKYHQLNEEDNLNFMQKFNQDAQEWLESDVGKAVTKSIDAIASGMSSLFSQLRSLMQAEMEMEVAAVEKKYDREIAAAQGNAYQTKMLEKKKQQEVKKIKDEANRKMYAMEVMQALAQTATAAINAYSSAAAIPLVGYIIAPIAAAMAVAAGMVQVAAIKKQQQQSASEGYAKGGFTKPGAVGEVAGVVHAGEWVASQKLLASPVARPLIEALDYAQRTNTIGSLRGSDVSRSITAPAVLANSQPQVIIQENAELREAIKRLKERLDEPFVTVNTVTGDLGIKQAQDSYQRLMNNKSPKSKRK